MLVTCFIVPSPWWSIAVNKSHGMEFGSGVALATGRPATRLPSDHSQVGPAKCEPIWLPDSSRSLASGLANTQLDPSHV